jgi:hypothetical protein
MDRNRLAIYIFMPFELVDPRVCCIYNSEAIASVNPKGDIRNRALHNCGSRIELRGFEDSAIMADVAIMYAAIAFFAMFVIAERYATIFHMPPVCFSRFREAYFFASYLDFPLNWQIDQGLGRNDRLRVYALLSRRGTRSSSGHTFDLADASATGSD